REQQPQITGLVLRYEVKRNLSESLCSPALARSDACASRVQTKRRARANQNVVEVLAVGLGEGIGDSGQIREAGIRRVRRFIPVEKDRDREFRVGGTKDVGVAGKRLQRKT